MTTITTARILSDEPIMLRILARSTAATAARSQRTRLAPSAVRQFCDGSHSDFEKKSTAGDDGGDETQAFIKKIVTDHPVLLFMKGTPDAPKCGFSQQVVRILHSHNVPFDSADVLKSASIREGIKSYSDWPTIPQLYINGEFVGGCDIVTNLHQEEELGELLAEAAALPAKEQA